MEALAGELADEGEQGRIPVRLAVLQGGGQVDALEGVLGRGVVGHDHVRRRRRPLLRLPLLLLLLRRRRIRLRRRRLRDRRLLRQLRRQLLGFHRLPLVVAPRLPPVGLSGLRLERVEGEVAGVGKACFFSRSDLHDHTRDKEPADPVYQGCVETDGRKKTKTKKLLTAGELADSRNHEILIVLLHFICRPGLRHFGVVVAHILGRRLLRDTGGSAGAGRVVTGTG